MSANTLTEFLNENMHRNYPILDQGDAKDITGAYNIPTELIADIRLIVPNSAVSGGVFFISGLVMRRYTADIEISYKPSAGVSAVIGWFHNIDIGSDIFASYIFVTVPQSESYAIFEDITGTLIAGAGLSAVTLPGAWNFDAESTQLVETAVSGQLTKFRSLQVGDEVFTGNIVLKEGDNVTISSSYDEGTDTTTITFSAKEIEIEDVFLVDDDSIIEALTKLYGAPIVTINEMNPAEDGNFTLKGADCINVDTDGPSGLKLTNPCGEPCCDKENYLTPVYDSLNQLNSRHVRLEDFLESSVDNLDTIIGRLKDMENSIGLGGF